MSSVCMQELGKSEGTCNTCENSNVVHMTQPLAALIIQEKTKTKMQTNQIHERISHLEFPFGKQKPVLEVWGFA